ncbi:MAG: hypothetical protein H0W73_01270, partial [Bacteroidetes bacterium]|nr:hypothetical protein [Bacteroidota bacterium]
MNLAFKRAGYCFLFFFNVLVFIPAQENDKDEVVSGYIKALTTLWETSNTKTFSNYIIDSSLTLKSEPFKVTNDSVVYLHKELLLKQNQLMQRINKKDVGLKYILNYQENFNSPVADPLEIVVFKRRAVTGIDWD